MSKLRDPVDATGKRLGPEAYLNEDNVLVPKKIEEVRKSYSAEYISEQEKELAELQLFQAELWAKRMREQKR